MILNNTFVNLATCFCENFNGFGVKNGILCGRSGNYHRVTECPNDHWCTGYANDSSQVVNSMDLCEIGNIKLRGITRIIKVKYKGVTCQSSISIEFLATVDCGYSQYAPRCSLCKFVHRTQDDSYNTWCGGHCFFDQEDSKCKIKGRLKMAKKKLHYTLYHY